MLQIKTDFPPEKLLRWVGLSFLFLLASVVQIQRFELLHRLFDSQWIFLSTKMMWSRVPAEEARASATHGRPNLRLGRFRGCKGLRA